jgi:hypothetical protein
MPIITSSSRTWPVQYRSRLEYTLPGNNFIGRTRRQSQDVLTHAPREWFKAVKHGGLGAMDDIAAHTMSIYEKVPKVFEPFVPWAQKNYDVMYGAVTTLAKDVMARNPNLNMEASMKVVQGNFPATWQLWVHSSQMLGYLRDTSIYAKEAVKHIKSTGVASDKEQRVAAAIEPKVFELANALTPEERKQIGLGFPPLAIAILTVIGGIVLGSYMVKNPFASDPEFKANAARASVSEIQMSPATPAAKQKAIDGVVLALSKDPIPKTTGEGLASLGGMAVIGIALWIGYKVFVQTGFVTSVGRGVGERIAHREPGHERIAGRVKERKAARELRVIERQDKLEFEREKKKSEKSSKRKGKETRKFLGVF